MVPEKKKSLKKKKNENQIIKKENESLLVQEKEERLEKGKKCLSISDKDSTHNLILSDRNHSVHETKFFKRKTFYYVRSGILIYSKERLKKPEIPPFSTELKGNIFLMGLQEVCKKEQKKTKILNENLRRINKISNENHDTSKFKTHVQLDDNYFEIINLKNCLKRGKSVDHILNFKKRSQEIEKLISNFEYNEQIIEESYNKDNSEKNITTEKLKKKKHKNKYKKVNKNKEKLKITKTASTQTTNMIPKYKKECNLKNTQSCETNRSQEQLNILRKDLDNLIISYERKETPKQIISNQFNEQEKSFNVKNLISQKLNNKWQEINDNHFNNKKGNQPTIVNNYSFNVNIKIQNPNSFILNKIELNYLNFYIKLHNDLIDNYQRIQEINNFTREIKLHCISYTENLFSNLISK